LPFRFPRTTSSINFLHQPRQQQPLLLLPSTPPFNNNFFINQSATTSSSIQASLQEPPLLPSKPPFNNNLLVNSSTTASSPSYISFKNTTSIINTFFQQQIPSSDTTSSKSNAFCTEGAPVLTPPQRCAVVTPPQRCAVMTFR